MYGNKCEGGWGGENALREVLPLCREGGKKGMTLWPEEGGFKRGDSPCKPFQKACSLEGLEFLVM